jgi:hypothetical protein
LRARNELTAKIIASSKMTADKINWRQKPHIQ